MKSNCIIKVVTQNETEQMCIDEEKAVIGNRRAADKQMLKRVTMIRDNKI